MQDNLDHARTELQITRMREAAQKGICCFCRENFEEYHTAPVEIENDSCLVTKNDFPYEGTVGHFLIVTKRHVALPQDMTEKEWRDFYSIFSDLLSKYPCEGGALVMRFGDPSYTGATIVHLHAHVIQGVSGKPGDERLAAYLGYKAT